MGLKTDLRISKSKVLKKCSNCGCSRYGECGCIKKNKEKAE